VQSIAGILARSGPLTGAELAAAGSFSDILELWKACHAPGLLLRRSGRRYLRLDSGVEGYARLSPSIRREFFTYSLVGLEGQQATLQARAGELETTAAAISREKLQVAAEAVRRAVDGLPNESQLLGNIVFLIAGDITYGMAHRVPRPERSSGEMVRGSDLDVIIVTTDSLPAEEARALDDAVHRQKHRLLIDPAQREEIDYVLKPLAKVRRQLAFDSFEHMVACKILGESRFLYGSSFLFDEVMGLVDASGVRGRLAALERAAEAERAAAERILLDPGATALSGRDPLALFYTRDEGEEIF
jgi:hypothetical protein